MSEEEAKDMLAKLLAINKEYDYQPLKDLCYNLETYIADYPEESIPDPEYPQ